MSFSVIWGLANRTVNLHILELLHLKSIQCFNTVHWVTRRASSLWKLPSLIHVFCFGGGSSAWSNSGDKASKTKLCLQLLLSADHVTVRGVVVRERGGTPFRQIFWSQNGALANIVGHRWNTNTEAFRQITSYSLGWPSISLFSGPNCPQTRDLASKISKIFPGWHLRIPSVGGGNPSCTHPQHGYMPCAGAQAPPLLGPRSRKPFPQIKIYHYTPCNNRLLSPACWVHISKSAAVVHSGRMMGQTDRPLHRPCSAYCAGSATDQEIMAVMCRWVLIQVSPTSGLSFQCDNLP